MTYLDYDFSVPLVDDMSDTVICEDVQGRASVRVHDADNWAITEITVDGHALNPAGLSFKLLRGAISSRCEDAIEQMIAKQSADLRLLEPML